MKGMRTCVICGRDFPLLVEDHYVARDPSKIGAIANLVNIDKDFEYDAFDCPHCGCQNIMQERKCPCDYGICDECDHVGEEEHDGCVGCMYEETRADEWPCNECKSNYVDLWQKEDK